MKQNNIKTKQENVRQLVDCSMWINQKLKFIFKTVIRPKWECEWPARMHNSTKINILSQNRYIQLNMCLSDFFSLCNVISLLPLSSTTHTQSDFFIFFIFTVVFYSTIWCFFFFNALSGIWHSLSYLLVIERWLYDWSIAVQNDRVKWDLKK